MAYRALGMTEKARDAYARHVGQLGDDRERLHFCHVTLHALGEFDLAAHCRPPRREGRPLFLTWWTRAVGHLAYLDSWVKARLLAGEPPGDPVVRTTPEATANRFYLSCWSHWFRAGHSMRCSRRSRMAKQVIVWRRLRIRSSVQSIRTTIFSFATN